MPKAKVNGINIDYMVEGQGEPLVMIMGLGGARSSWRFQTGTFKRYYRTITFDNRSVGKSDRPADPYTIKMMADDALGLMDHLGIQKAHVLGVSMGGMIAQELAINHPERVDKLVLGCTFAKAGTDADSPEMKMALETYGKSPQDEASQRRLVSAMLGLSFNKRSNRVFILPFAKIAVRFSSISGTIEQMKAISTHDTTGRLGMIRAPTLVITGTEDRLVNPASSEMIASLVPNSKVVRVPGGGHTFFMEMHDDFNREVLRFLKDAL
jgi:pimeloyl-ACP methyl ester carboxylesterase